MNNNQLTIHSILQSSKANGPGDRCVVWLAGCRLSCPGCWNSQLFSYSNGDQLSVTELVDRILESGAGGVSFSGGEPTDQLPNLMLVMELLLEADPNYSILMYSGRTEAELNRGEFGLDAGSPACWTYNAAVWQRVRSLLSIAVLGRYDRTLEVREPLRSSSNQEVLHLRDIPEELETPTAEFLIDADAKVVVTGFPSAVLQREIQSGF